MKLIADVPYTVRMPHIARGRLTGMKFLQRTLQASAIFFAFAAVSVAVGQESFDQEQMKVEGQVEKKYTLKLETTQHKLYCKAGISIEYTQRNTMARVSGTIENEDCAASSGGYIVAVRYRDEDGEIHNAEHPETWRRDDAEPFTLNHEYLIGDNMDLIRVRARKIQCVCAEMPADLKETETQGETE